MEFFRDTHFDFMSRRKIAIAISLAAILAGMVSLVIKGGPAYNIDFLGGTEVQVQFRQPKETQALREVLASINLAGAEIKQFGNNRDFVIREEEEEIATQISDRVMTALKQAFPEDPPELFAVNRVGPKIGKELRESAVWAVLISLVLLLLYISVRFEFVFAVGAVIALFHDVMITLGVFSILNLEISLTVVAAFLTLVGYSLNDTIVVFDRIRENLKVHRRESLPIEHLINLSINETLSRTIITGVTSLLVVIVFLFFGGEVLHDFFFCLLFGILIGTYSSVFIAAPIVVGWYKRHQTAKIKRQPVTVG
jgi:preprotein translocase subunit SecF